MKPCQRCGTDVDDQRRRCEICEAKLQAEIPPDGCPIVDGRTGELLGHVANGIGLMTQRGTFVWKVG